MMMYSPGPMVACGDKHCIIQLGVDNDLATEVLKVKLSRSVQSNPHTLDRRYHLIAFIMEPSPFPLRLVCKECEVCRSDSKALIEKYKEFLEATDRLTNYKIVDLGINASMGKSC